MTHNSSINNTVIPFLLWTKWSQQSPNFETPKCSGENLPNFSCNFSNHQPVFLQILYHSSMSSKMTPLYFFGSNIIYFAQKEHIKVKIFETFECSGQNLSNSLWEFWNFEWIRSLSKICISLCCHKENSLYFFSSNNVYFAQKELVKMKMFETFKYASQNSSDYSCQFWNDKSIPFQILHHSSLSRHLTPL